jgi:NAD-dependent SIR2 family protein deacetylase
MSVGATVIEVNPDRTDLSPAADIVLSGPAGVLLPRVLDALP